MPKTRHVARPRQHVPTLQLTAYHLLVEEVIKNHLDWHVENYMVAINVWDPDPNWQGNLVRVTNS